VNVCNFFALCVENQTKPTKWLGYFCKHVGSSWELYRNYEVNQNYICVPSHISLLNTFIYSV